LEIWKCDDLEIIEPVFHQLISKFSNLQID